MSKEDLVNNYGEMLVNTSTKLVEYQQDINRYRKPVFDTEDMMDAFEAGWDAGKQENEHLVWQISEANFEKGKEIGRKEFLDRAAEFMELYILNHDNIDIFEMEEEFRKAMEK